MFIKYIVSFAIITALIGCTHTPSVGDKILAQSDSTQQMGMEWKQGEKDRIQANKLTKKGDKLVKKGNKNIGDGNKMVFNGKKQVSSGKELMKEGRDKMLQGEIRQSKSEQQFREAFSGELDAKNE